MQAEGQHLSQVGGRIVAKVFLGLLEKDPLSYLRNHPRPPRWGAPAVQIF